MTNKRIAGSNKALERLEPCAGKLARTVLKGASSSNAAGLPDFAFVGRQYHLEIGKKDYYIDLLFYHVKLKSYIVIELKSGDFKPEYTGKMNFYLSAVDDLLKSEDDNNSIGLILCKTKDKFTAIAYRFPNFPDQ